MLIIVLSDGETYSHINGCQICDFPDDAENDQIEDELGPTRGVNIEYILDKARQVVDNPDNPLPMSVLRRLLDEIGVTNED